MNAIKRLLVGELQSITGAAILIGASSLVSRLLGVLRERLLVGAFGVGDKLDAYYASFQAPNFLYNLLILGTLSVALIPVFVEWYEKDRREAWRIAGAVFNLTALTMGALALLLIVFAPVFTRLVAPGFSGEKFTLTVSLTRVMALSPLLFAVSSVFGSVLNARRNYLVAALAPLVYNVSIIAGIVFGAPRYGVYAVAVAVTVGAAAHALLQAAAALAIGFRPASGLGLENPGVRLVGKLFFPRVWGIDISQISLLIGSVIGSTLAVGSVALFNLATNIQTVSVGVFGIPFAIAAFPIFSTALARGDRKQFLAVLSRTARQIVFFLLPLGAMTIVLRAHLIRLVIGTEKLSWNDTRLAAAALAFFAVSMFLQGLTPLFSRAFYALKNTVIPVVISGGAVLVYIGVAYGLLAFFGDRGVSSRLVDLLRLRGVADLRMLALPVSFSIASAAQAAALVAVLRLKYGPLDGRRIAFSVVKTLAASLAALVATRLGLYLATAVFSDHTFFGILGQTVFAAALGFAAFFAIALLARSEEAVVFLTSLRRRLLRISRPLGIGEATDMQ